MADSDQKLHRWRFFRAGGFDQVKLATGADFLHLDELDQKLWVALACPIAGLEFDARTAALIDTDKDGRIRAAELIAAVKWVGALLKNPDDLVRGLDPLPLSAINDALPEGRQLVASARQILQHLGQQNTEAISVADASDANRIFLNTLFNGDGVIIPESAEDEFTRGVIADIATCSGTINDRCGKAGIDQVRADDFFAACDAFDGWMKLSETDAAAILPLGPATSAAAEAVRAVKAKVDDYFGRCRLAAYDPRAIPALNRKEEEYIAIVARNISISATEIESFPLTQVAPGKPLTLTGPLNPAHAAAIATLREQAVKPFLGDRNELTEADWLELQSRLAAFEAWSKVEQGKAVEKLGIQRIREILAAGSREKITALIVRDQALAMEAAAIANVERMARYARDLGKLCQNFVNFKHLYSGDEPAIFQSGTLYLDQRSCTLCLTVEDPARHAGMAGLAGAYLAYVDCVRKGTGEKMSVVAVFSQGDDENLMVGRNGIFYDRRGLDYDATISKILPNPISLRQASWSPYKKLVRFIEEQVAKRAAAADADANAQLAGMVATPAAPAAPAAAGTPAKPAFDPSIIALLSVALGSLAVAFASVLTFLGKFAAWELPFVCLGSLILVSGPSMLLAFIKLRKRNLGPILDANGWAINSKARINVPFGTSLTGIAKLPAGSTVDIHDKYAEKSAALPKVLGTLFVIWWIYAFMYDTGPLYLLTEDWDRPWGKPPASLAAQMKNDGTNTVILKRIPKPKSGTATTAEATNSPAAAKPAP